MQEIALTYSPTHSNTDTVKCDAVNKMNYNIISESISKFYKKKNILHVH